MSKIPTPQHEPVLSYAPGTPERVELKRTLKDLSARVLEIPVVVGGREVRTGKTVDAVMPHCHRHILAKVHQAGPKEIEGAIAAAREAWREWSAWSLERRAAVFLKAADVSARVLADRHFGGIHFTGSTEVFQGLWRQVAGHLGEYADYPRLVGETGGKDFILAHASADVDALAAAIVRGAYEYQGQKCSAASRAYVPDTLWPRVKERVLDMLGGVRVGDPADFRSFMGAVIDRKAFEKIKGYVDEAKQARGVSVLFGGGCDDSDGWFVQPTLLQVDDPGYRTMCEEIFGPVLTVYAYPEKQWRATLQLVDRTSPHALTGAVIAQYRASVGEALLALRYG